MPDAKAKRDLLRLTQECALDPQQWTRFLKEFAQAVQAVSAALVIQDLKNSRGNVAANWGVDPLWERRYQDHYAGTNVWTQRSRDLLNSGAAFGSEQVIGAADLLETEFYNDFLRPQGAFYGLGAGLSHDDSVSTFITAIRSKQAGPYRASERRLLNQLMPHLETAVRIRHRIAGLEDQVWQLGAALDDLPQGIIIADRLSRVIFMNRRAEKTVREKDGLWIANDGLCASLSQDTTQLRAWIARVTGERDHPGGVLSITRPEQEPLKLLIAPMRPSPRRPIRGTSALIWVAFPEPLAHSSPALLQRLFRFTVMEARLTAALLEGKSLQEFAESASITASTAKTHLKNLFTKTGVSRQSALIRYVLNVVDQLGRPR